MKNSRSSKPQNFFGKFSNELLLYSGQYALFYIIMNFSKDGLSYFEDIGHTILLFILILQAIFLVYFGKKFWGRLLGSLLAPLFYTIVEFKFDLDFLSNIAHVMFWVFSLVTGLLQAFQINETRLVRKKIFEFTNTFINILIFIFMYFYFDLFLSQKDLLSLGKIGYAEYMENLNFTSLLASFKIFMTDSAHVFLTAAGLLLSLSLGVGRIKVIELTEKIRKLFGKYVDDEIRDKIIVDGKGKSEKVQLGVLFIDIKNFTSVSENHSPEKITGMLNTYFNIIAQKIHSNQGIIDKYIGDGLMAVFGLGKDGATACNNAHKCSKEILQIIPFIQAELEKSNLPVIEGIRIGVHYGFVIAGDIGSEERVNYTFIGDTVNTAARLESYCKELKTNYLISASVYGLLNEQHKLEFVKEEQPIFVKGKEIPITVYNYFKE